MKSRPNMTVQCRPMLVYGGWLKQDRYNGMTGIKGQTAKEVGCSDR